MKYLITPFLLFYFSLANGEAIFDPIGKQYFLPGPECRYELTAYSFFKSCTIKDIVNKTGIVINTSYIGPNHSADYVIDQFIFRHILDEYNHISTLVGNASVTYIVRPNEHLINSRLLTESDKQDWWLSYYEHDRNSSSDPVFSCIDNSRALNLKNSSCNGGQATCEWEFFQLFTDGGFSSGALKEWRKTVVAANSESAWNMIIINEPYDNFYIERCQNTIFDLIEVDYPEIARFPGYCKDVWNHKDADDVEQECTLD